VKICSILQKAPDKSLQDPAQAWQVWRQSFAKMLNGRTFNCYNGQNNLENSSIDLKRKLTVVTVLFLFLIAFSLASASMASVPRANAASSYSFYATPSTGVKSSHANLVGTGLPPNTELQFLFGTVQIGVLSSGPEGRVDMTITVPLVSPGNYVISAKDSAGVTYASTGFTVVDKLPTASPTASVSLAPGGETPRPSQYPSPTANPSFHVYPITTLPPYSYSPGTPKPVDGGISPLMIGIIVVAIIAIVIPVTFFVRRRGGPEPIYEDARETPAAPAPTYSTRTGTTPIAPAVQRSAISSRFEMFEQPVSRPSDTPSYGQSKNSQEFSRSGMTSRPGMPPRYGQSAPATRVCPHCRQNIRADYSICPHCHKRLK